MKSHPQRLVLHNEIHARPPEPMAPPLAISHLVMACGAGEREASRAHLAQLLRNHHLPTPDDQTTHLRAEVSGLRLRWELHTEFVSWTFARPFDPALLEGGAPPAAAEAAPRDWLAGLPGQWLAGMHLWVVGAGAGVPPAPLLREDVVASQVADGEAEVYTDFALHPDGLRIGISNGLVCEKPGKPDSALGGQPMPAWMAWNWRLGRCLVWIRPALTARLALVGP